MLASTMNDEITQRGSTDIEIIAYTCDDEVYGCECENHCIDVSGFMIDASTISNMAALSIGGSDAINGHYFYDSLCDSASDSSCHINDNEDGYRVELTLLEDTNPDGGDNFCYVCFDYVEAESPDKKYQIHYECNLGANTDFACELSGAQSI